MGGNSKTEASPSLRVAKVDLHELHRQVGPVNYPAIISLCSASQWLGGQRGVRYAWGDSPICNLHNWEGLPASPFRTDNWPGISNTLQDKLVPTVWYIRVPPE